MKSKSEVINLGCRLNACESEGIRDILDKNNILNTTVINTCAVTNQAFKKSIYEIKKAKRTNPKNKILVTGCASHIEPETFFKMKEVDRLIDNKKKNFTSSYKSNLSCVIEKTEKLIDCFPKSFGISGKKTRALLQIQQGCDHRCTFCIIPFGRGNSISLPLSEINVRARKIIKEGYKEIVITGVDLTSYGNDIPGKPKLGQTLKRLLNLQPKIKRIRLSSIDPAEVDDDLIELIMFEKKIMPHIHFSMQSGDDLILKRMKRRHNSTELINLCEKLKSVRNEITFGADVIVGFPTETELNFLNTIKCISECKFSNLHIFPFSPKNGTPASKMPQVTNIEKKRRINLITILSSKIRTELMNKKLGSRSNVLFENMNLSYTNDYFKVCIDKKNKDLEKYKGKVIQVVLEKISRDYFIGKVIE